MAGLLTPPPIDCAPEISRAFCKHKGEPCVVVLATKYFSEKDWVTHRLWMCPGWDTSDIWRSAHQWLYHDAISLYYDGSEVEKVRFDCFKLV